MMGGVSFQRIDRKSSLETEPRTLNFRQIDIAREAALYVLNTRSVEEACRVFTEGLEPVETRRMRNDEVPRMAVVMDLDECMDEELRDECPTPTPAAIRPISCSQQVNEATLRHVLTAPF